MPSKVPANPHTILFASDSISDGWHASIKAKGFVYLVQCALHPKKIFHTHRHGFTVSQVGEKFVVPANIDLAIVELGTNDVNRGTTYEAFSDNYHSYIGRVMTKSPEAALICLGVFTNTPRAQDFDKVIQGVCDSHHGTFIKINDLRSNKKAVGPVGKQTWIGRANLGHPNDYGHALIAERVLSITGPQN